jgi:hypothetical protein
VQRFPPTIFGEIRISPHFSQVYFMKSYKSLICNLFPLFLIFSANNTLSDAAKLARLLRCPENGLLNVPNAHMLKYTMNSIDVIINFIASPGTGRGKLYI